MRNDTILVTGAAGCIGAWVVAGLVRRGIPAVVFDRSDDRRRLRLVLDEDRTASVPWIVGDVTDTADVDRAVGASGAAAVIHLAALQVPFCKADPVAGARVNVVGHVNLLECARRRGIRRFVYASSVAALPLAGARHPHTLYGVYKAADEGIAQVYAADWGVSSIGLRPHTVYGPGRDQGMTSAPTVAMLAAAAGRPFTIPFRGALSFQYTGEVAEIFIRCATADLPHARAEVFDLAGVTVTVEEIVEAIRAVVPDSSIAIDGPALPFPASFDERPLRALVGDWRPVPLSEGVGDSVVAFRDLLARGLVSHQA